MLLVSMPFCIPYLYFTLKHNGLHIFLHHVILDQILGEDHERLEREYI